MIAASGLVSELNSMGWQPEGSLPQQRVHSKGCEQAMKTLRLVVAEPRAAEDATDVAQHGLFDW